MKLREAVRRGDFLVGASLSSWRCTTGLLDEELAWGEALQRIAMPAAQLESRPDFHGEVTTVTSPRGIEFSKVSSSAQTFAGPCISNASWLWLALPMVGIYELDDHGRRLRPELGEVFFGLSGDPSTLRLTNDFALLYVRIPSALVDLRILNLRQVRLGILTKKNPLTRVLSNLLYSVADNLDDLTDEDLRPIEVALIEMVVSKLSAKSSQNSFDLARASNFQRVCQAIEQRLGDEIALEDLADSQGFSARYIQKLFEQAGSSYSQYIRERRLDHCCADLASGAHRNLAVREICFRWGFNDAAHFTRTFKAQYGVTPTDYRRKQLHGGSQIEYNLMC